MVLSIDVYNKIDAISLEQMDKLAHEDHTAVISCELDLQQVVFSKSLLSNLTSYLVWITSWKEFGKIWVW